MARGGIEFLLEHFLQLAAVIGAGQRIATDFLGQAARAVFVLVGFLSRACGFLYLAQVAHHQQFATRWHRQVGHRSLPRNYSPSCGECV